MMVSIYLGLDIVVTFKLSHHRLKVEHMDLKVEILPKNVKLSLGNLNGASPDSALQRYFDRLTSQTGPFLWQQVRELWTFSSNA